MAKESNFYWLTLPAERTKRPLIWEMSKQFDLIFDLRSANITDKVGIIALELTGERKTIEATVKWLRRKRSRLTRSNWMLSRVDFTSILFVE
jgi:ABC-type methionine transport system ATPase subunit